MTDRAFHLLVIDDDQRIRSLLRNFLYKAGFRITVANDANHARQLLKSLKFDLLICDVMMPGEDGVTLTNSISNILSVPIILLTAKGDALDRITGLQAGADDYIAKPFEPQELLLRIQAILRRAPRENDNLFFQKSFKMGEFVYKLDSGELWRGTDLVRLTTTEAILMQIFSKRSNVPISRAKLVSELGRDKGQAQERAIDVQITRLRRKIEVDPKAPRYLQTVRSAGYMFTPD
jgi:two-component system, OmpR family, phosphate regulon response regulator OmpR